MSNCKYRVLQRVMWGLHYDLGGVCESGSCVMAEELRREVRGSISKDILYNSSSSSSNEGSSK